MTRSGTPARAKEVPLPPRQPDATWLGSIAERTDNFPRNVSGGRDGNGSAAPLVRAARPSSILVITGSFGAPMR